MNWYPSNHLSGSSLPHSPAPLCVNKSPFTGQFFKMTTFALPSMGLIFLRSGLLPEKKLRRWGKRSKHRSMKSLEFSRFLRKNSCLLPPFPRLLRSHRSTYSSQKWSAISFLTHTLNFFSFTAFSFPLSSNLFFTLHCSPSLNLPSSPGSFYFFYF